MSDDSRPDPIDVETARRTIDDVDREVLQLLARRFAAVRSIAAAKRDDTGRPFLDAERERRILERWVAEARTLDLPVPLAREVLREVLRYSRRVQEPLIRGDATASAVEQPRVSIQGMGDCYSALAARRLMATRSVAEARILEFHTFSEAVDALVDRSVDYGRSRKAFGKPIIKREVWQHRFADRYTELEAARQLTYSAVDDYNRERYDNKSALSFDTVKKISMAKLYASEVADKVFDDCLQFHGGLGYMEESFIARAWRDQRLVRIGGGTSEVMRYAIAKLLGF